MTESVKNITYKTPVLGTSEDNPVYTENGAAVEDGNLSQTLVSDTTSQAMLSSILKELKIMNLHLALITDTHITEQENL